MTENLPATRLPGMADHPGSHNRGRSARILSGVFRELKDNPPAILAKTRAKKGAKRAGKQRIAIALSKARAAGADIPRG